MSTRGKANSLNKPTRIQKRFLIERQRQKCSDRGLMDKEQLRAGKWDREPRGEGMGMFPVALPKLPHGTVCNSPAMPSPS